MAAHARSHPWIARTIKVASIGCVSGALAIGAWLGWFYVHSAIGGAGLLAQARARITAADGSSQRNGCRLPRASGSGAVGEIVVPSLSLVAPVVQGDGAAQLADAVGHVPTSVWPGQAGTPVFAGHDVTWFHDLGHLKPGQEIEYVSGCRARVYAVLRNEIVGQVGDPGREHPRVAVLGHVLAPRRAVVHRSAHARRGPRARRLRGRSGCQCAVKPASAGARRSAFPRVGRLVGGEPNAARDAGRERKPGGDVRREPWTPF